MTRPATAKQGVAGKEKVDYFICVWLVGIQSDGAFFPQINQTISRVCHSLDQLEVWTEPPFSNGSANLLRLCEALSVASRVVIAAFKKWPHKSIVIKGSKGPFFLVLDHHCRLAVSVLLLAQCPLGV
jgi:hypothetical protein